MNFAATYYFIKGGQYSQTIRVVHNYQKTSRQCFSFVVPFLTSISDDIFRGFSS